jgi:hypothetical protein
VSLLPSTEQELMRVARASVGGSTTRVRSPGRLRLSGAVLAVAVSVVALMIGAGFLLALRGSGAHGGSPAAPTPTPSRGLFPGAPRSQPPRVGRDGYRCRPAPRNHDLPRHVGCVTVLRLPVVPGDRGDLVILYARLGRRAAGGFPPGRYTLELVRPSGAIERTPLPATDAPPTFLRAGNLNGNAGQEIVLHLDDVSSGDTYGLVTFDAGRLVLVHPLLSAGGDSVFREGFACRPGPPARVISRTMVLGNSQPVYGRWRWTVTTYAWHGAVLRRISRDTFMRRGLPGRSAMTRGTGCGRPTGATQSHPG